MFKGYSFNFLPDKNFQFSAYFSKVIALLSTKLNLCILCLFFQDYSLTFQPNKTLYFLLIFPKVINLLFNQIKSSYFLLIFPRLWPYFSTKLNLRIFCLFFQGYGLTFQPNEIFVFSAYFYKVINLLFNQIKSSYFLLIFPRLWPYFSTKLNLRIFCLFFQGYGLTFQPN